MASQPASSTPSTVSSLRDSVFNLSSGNLEPKDYLFSIKDQLDRVNNYLMTKRIHKDVLAHVATIINDAKTMITNKEAKSAIQYDTKIQLQNEVKTIIREELEKFKENQTIVQNSVTNVKSYAAALKFKNPPIILIKIILSNKTKTDPAQMREKLQKMECPEIKIKKVTVLPSGDVKLQTFQSTSSALNTLQKSNLKDEFEIKQQPPKIQKVIIFSVPQTITDEDLIQTLAKTTETETEIRSCNKTISGRKEGYTHRVFSLPAHNTQTLLDSGKLYHHFQGFIIKKYKPFLRCRRCQDFGHHESRCPNSFLVCENCAGTHDISQCTNPNSVCYNCRDHNKKNENQNHFKTDHKSSSSQCKIFQEYLATIRN